MIAFGTKSVWETMRRPIDVDGTISYKGEWMSTGEGPGLSPTIFLAEQAANFRFRPHYHRVNQFQLFVGGDGVFGKRPIRPLVVHYAGAYTGYGPIVGGAHGIDYFTIRARFETGFTPLDEPNENLRKGPKRHARSEPWTPYSLEQLASFSTPRSAQLIDKTEDGMYATSRTLPAHVVHRPLPMKKCAGIFILLLEGNLSCGEQTFGKWESIFVSHGESIELKASDGGVEFLELSMPEQAAVYEI